MSPPNPFRTETSADLLVVYTGNRPVDAAIFGAFLDRWAAQLASGERFGVILVYEAYDYTQKARDAQAEDAFTRVMGEFRRRYRTQVQQLCTGFSRVFPAAWLAAMDEGKAAQYQEKTSRFAEYMFGVRGADVASLAEAKAWLASVADKAPLDLGQDADKPGQITQSQASRTIGFYYGSTTGTTEFVAEKLQDAARHAGLELNPVNISNVTDPQELLAHDQLILGLPTWNIGQLQDDWLILFPQLDTLDFSGKRVALFGVGDQLGYPDNFLDALGILGNKLLERGAELTGFCSTEGYNFSASKAQIGDQFMGLGIDEYNQAELTASRLTRWLQQIEREFSATQRVAESVSL